ncbi:MAG: hypothetical protein AUJ97_07170 [Bacteroidetes bacterium CG2_30_32_10]|nr:MAG: hypothetical protein AUJ97_07170 [Bacteroidetes bacterium CG2_30_32_10]
MKKLYVIVIANILLISVLQAQLINVNPDPNGEQWIAGGFKEPTTSEMQIINQIPELKIPLEYQSKLLPTSIDNSLNQYFRPIFNQVGGSCAQASGVGYNFTYEMDFRRNVPANVLQNQYPSHFTYNFLNDGSMENGSTYFDGWNIIKFAGCPNVSDFGGMSPPNDINWITGYNKYFNGMHNKSIDYFKISVNTPEGLEILKNYFNDHGEAAAVGGLVNFSAGATDYTMMNLPAGTPHAGMAVITQWGPSVNHAMTFVGFDDNIKYDFNNDGLYTNNLDINSDGIIDMRDWEIGGLIVANSWGTFWGNSGKCYMMYKLLAETTTNGGIWSNAVYGIHIKPIYDPMLTFKVTLKHNSRKQIRITAGSSPDVNATSPSYTLAFPLFNNQGGNFYMQGGATLADQTIEIGLDVTPLLSNLQNNLPAKFFLMIDEVDPSNSGQGEIVSFSIISYTNGVEETICPETHVALINNSKTTLSIVKSVAFDPVNITTTILPEATFNQPYSQQLNATGGNAPYKWNLKIDYTEQSQQGTFPTINSQQLTPDSDDDGFAKVVLGFPFMFYGNYYDSVYVTTDGSIIFNNEFSYIRTNDNLIVSKAITVYGSDLQIYPSQGDGIWYEGDNNHATFRWKTSLFDVPEDNFEMAVTLYANGEIHFFYGNGITPGIIWTAGVSNGDGVNYSIASISNAPLVLNDTKLKFVGTDFPMGMQLDENGVFHGTPIINDRTWNISFVATDFNYISNSKTIPFTVGYLGLNNINNEMPSITSNPNPFTNEVTCSINDKKPDSKHITIDIIDINGKLISNVCNQVIVLRNNNIIWNGNDISNNQVISGIYFVRIKMDNIVKYQKIIKL